MGPPFVHIAGELAGRRGVHLAGAILLVAGAASGFLPLLDVPGYELGEVAALVAALLAPALALPAARLERTRVHPSPAAAFGGAALLGVGLLALLFGGALLHAVVGPCAALGPDAAFLPLLALPSMLLGVAVATAAAFVARGRGLPAWLLHLAVVAVSLAWTLLRAYRGPAAFLFDPLLGAWPGPLYDEALRIDARLALYRLDAAAWAVVVIGLAEAVVRGRRRARSRTALVPALVAVAALGAVLSARLALDALDASGDRAAVARALGGRREGPRCTLVFPSEKPAAAIEALLRDCEFHAADVASLLGVPDPPRVTVYVHRSAAEKRKLVGAAATEFAKPWLFEAHVADAPLPHPVLRHEIAHAVSAAIAGGPLRVPARAGILVSAGLVEGLAVALEVPRSEWTVHEWSRAARDLGLLPDLARIVGPAGFWTQAPARAYTATGSFLAFLLARHGPEKTTRAYRTGDVAGAVGEPLAALVAEWHRFLDGVEVPDGLRAAARARLARKSLFARPCAREVARLEAEAARAAGLGRAEEACRLWRSAGEHGDSARAEKLSGDALARSGDLDAAARAYERATVRAAPEDAALRAAVAAAEGDLAWRRGDVDRAAEAWRRALATHPDRGDARLLAAKLVAVADPELAAAAGPLLLGHPDAALALGRLARSPHPLAAYLMGRAFFQRGEAAAAVPELERAIAGLLPAALADEARFLAAEARCLAGDPAGGEARLAELSRGVLAAADRERLDATARRCLFERARSGALGAGR